MKKDIENIEDIKLMVNVFYEKIQADELLSPIFGAKIDDWSNHLENMYLFWNAALLGIRGYVGNPFLRHANLPVSSLHFERWLYHFYTTVDTHFEGNMAIDAKKRAEIMAFNFNKRMETNRKPKL